MLSCASCLCVSDLMVGMGYSRDKINDSLAKMKYDDITATYLLLGRRAAEVSGRCHGNPHSARLALTVLSRLSFRERRATPRPPAASPY